MERINPTEPADLRQYLSVLRNRKWTILLVATLVIAGVMAMTMRETPIYRAKSRLLIHDGGEEGFNLSNEIQLMSSSTVAEKVAEKLASDKEPRKLLGGLDVQRAVEDSDVVSINYLSADAGFAAAAANAFAQAYIDVRIEEARAQRAEQEAGIRARLEDANEELAKVTQQLGQAQRSGDESAAGSLATQQTILISDVSLLRSELKALPEVSDRAGGQILEEANVPGRPASPNLRSSAILAVFFGLILGIAAAFLRERLDFRFRDKDEVSGTLRAPVLAMVPKVKRGRRQKDQQLIIMNQQKTTASEVFRSLRTNLQYIAAAGNVKSIVVTSAAPGEGKTTTATNLGMALAQAGQRVILVSADLRRPNLERHFGIERQVGLTTWLMSQTDSPWPLLVNAGVPHMRILPSGPIPPNPSELLASPRLEALLRLLEQHSDIVVIDATPALPLADAVILASRADATLMVVNAKRTHRQAAAQAREALGRVEANVIGIVLNEVDESLGPDYSYYYTYDTVEPEVPKAASGGGSKVELLQTKEQRGKRFGRGS